LEAATVTAYLAQLDTIFKVMFACQHAKTTYTQYSMPASVSLNVQLNIMVLLIQQLDLVLVVLLVVLFALVLTFVWLGKMKRLIYQTCGMIKYNSGYCWLLFWWVFLFTSFIRSFRKIYRKVIYNKKCVQKVMIIKMRNNLNLMESLFFRLKQKEDK